MGLASMDNQKDTLGGSRTMKTMSRFCRIAVAGAVASALALVTAPSWARTIGGFSGGMGFGGGLGGFGGGPFLPSSGGLRSPMPGIVDQPCPWVFGCARTPGCVHCPPAPRYPSPSGVTLPSEVLTPSESPPLPSPSGEASGGS
jgi:hypothetical protein